MKLDDIRPTSLFSHNGEDFLRTANEVDQDGRSSGWDSIKIVCVNLESGDVKHLDKTIDVKESRVKFVIT